jgi:hypothetical protein
VSDAGRIRPPAFRTLPPPTPRLPAAKAIPVPMGSSAKSPVKRPFRAAHLPRSMETRLPAASLNIQRIGLRGSPAQFLKNRIHLIHRQASRADIV